MRIRFSAQAITALYLDNQSMPIITSKLHSSTGSRAVSFKVSLSSALIATVALLIIVVVVAVVVVGVVVIVVVVVIGIDWLSRYNAVIACAEKRMRIPFRNEILTIRGDGRNERNESRLNINSCSKSQEYISKGCHVFLANITSTKDEDKSTGKRLEDVPVVQEFLEVFPKDLPGIPPTRQVEF
nr:reverse transcriptase domain-containing protein [Tanacetum cinerariifolium]